jgi:hypothetical protein
LPAELSGRIQQPGSIITLESARKIRQVNDFAGFNSQITGVHRGLAKP